MSFCEDFFVQIRCGGLRSKYFRFPSALAEALAKSVGSADILHNSNYNDDFLSSKITTLKIVRSELIITIM